MVLLSIVNSGVHSRATRVLGCLRTGDSQLRRIVALDGPSLLDWFLLRPHGRGADGRLRFIELAKLLDEGLKACAGDGQPPALVIRSRS